MPTLSPQSIAKARRLVDEGRVREITPTRTFSVEGDHRAYVVLAADGAATCTCSAYGPCSHAEAVLTVVGDAAADEIAAGAEPDDAPGPPLFTASYRAVFAPHANMEGLTIVRTSLGKPRWIGRDRANAMPYASELAPHGLFHIEDDGEFDRRYRDRLDGIGTTRIAQRFREIRDIHGGHPLVLCCFEQDRKDCHRGTFANWWEDRTGEQIPELPGPT